VTPGLVLMTLLLCSVTAHGWGDDCEHIEIRARSCAEAAAWARGWTPTDWAVVAATCTEQRQAAR
jgi:hypothetical protein